MMNDKAGHGGKNNGSTIWHNKGKKEKGRTLVVFPFQLLQDLFEQGSNS